MAPFPIGDGAICVLFYRTGNSIEHSVPVAPLYRDVLETWRHSTTGYTPTLVVVYGGPDGERFFYERDNVWENERLLRYVPRDQVDPQSRRRWK
ncbi:MAG: hypothetical protein ACI9W4_001028, partial [Rhodothermales bacterium]